MTLFTSNTREVNFHPQDFIKDTLIPLDKKPKSLGLNLTPMFKATSHLDILGGEMKKSHQLLKALKGQDWGKKETLQQTYQAYIKPTFIIGAPAWYPNVNPDASSMVRLQSVQNFIMRTITSAHQISSQEHHLAETRILSVREQFELSCSRFLAGAMQADHTSHSIVILLTGFGPGRKEIVHTLQSIFGHVIRPHLNDDSIIPGIRHQCTLKAIHTAAVMASKQKLINKINPIESSLPRHTRSTFCQLCSQCCNS
jgi:hypothetical protein